MNLDIKASAVTELHMPKPGQTIINLEEQAHRKIIDELFDKPRFAIAKGAIPEDGSSFFLPDPESTASFRNDKPLYGPTLPESTNGHPESFDKTQILDDLEFSDYDSYSQRIERLRNIGTFNIPTRSGDMKLKLGNCGSGIKGICITIPR